MNRYCVYGLAVVGLMAVAAGSTRAATEFSIGYDGAYQADVGVAGYMNPEDVYLTPFQATYVAGDALPFPTSNPFYTFCVDISPNLVTPGWWQAGTFPIQGNQNGNAIPYVNGGIQQAANLYNTFVGSVDISTPQGELNGAALQVAIWQSLYGSAFQITPDGSGSNLGAVLGVESAMMAAAGFPNYNLTSTFWNATNPSYNQDLIGPQMETGFVPEPGIYAVAAAMMGLAAFYLTGRRQQAC